MQELTETKLAGKPEGKRMYGRPSCRWVRSPILKWILRK